MAITNQLPQYVEQNTDLIYKVATDIPTLNRVEVLLNVKGKQALNYLDSTVEFADGKECGFTDAGEDKLSQREIEVKPIKINKTFCEAQLTDTYMNYELKIAAGMETLPFEEAFITSNLNAIAEKLEKAIWQGDGSLIQGFNNLIANGDGVVLKTAADQAALVDTAYDNMPQEALDLGAEIYVSPAVYRAWVKKQNETCCANRTLLDAGADEIVYPGDSRVKVVVVKGLAGVDVAIGTWAKNLVYGTDIADSQNKFKFWYSDDDQIFKLAVKFAAGVQYKFGDEIVYVTIA